MSRAEPARAVVFDLDGTLIDSRADIAAAANAMLRECGLPEQSLAQIASYVGDGARWLVARAAGVPIEEERVDRLVQSFLSHYAAHPLDHTRLMPGALAALQALSDLPLALCTNKPRVTTDLVLTGLGLRQYFQTTLAGDELAQSKPHPLPLLHIASELGLSAGALVMVGDGPQDIECGRAAGARTIGVLGGILPPEQLVATKPDALLSSLLELPSQVRAWQSAQS